MGAFESSFHLLILSKFYLRFRTSQESSAQFNLHCCRQIWPFRPIGFPWIEPFSEPLCEAVPTLRTNVVIRQFPNRKFQTQIKFAYFRWWYDMNSILDLIMRMTTGHYALRPRKGGFRCKNDVKWQAFNFKYIAHVSFWQLSFQQDLTVVIMWKGKR